MYNQQQLNEKLKQLRVDVSFTTLYKYEKKYLLITPPERGAGYGGKWSSYDDVVLIEFLACWLLLNRENRKELYDFFSQYELQEQSLSIINQNFSVEDVFIGRALALKNRDFIKRNKQYYTPTIIQKNNGVFEKLKNNYSYAYAITQNEEHQRLAETTEWNDSMLQANKLLNKLFKNYFDNSEIKKADIKSKKSYIDYSEELHNYYYFKLNETAYILAFAMYESIISR